jgi:Mrp family chromosome partitioning ATPase
MQNVREKDSIEQEKRLRERMSKIKYKLLVLSGKGGVGKSTVAVNLAYGLAMSGKKVGILDVDMHGPNIPKMLGIEDKKLMGSESAIEPVEVLPQLKAVSMACILENRDQPVIWRGPLKMITIRQFLADVNWGDLDYLIVDSPPGTGDEPLSVCQLVPDISGAVVVTTPQDVAILDSRKSIMFAKELKIPVLGIIENMSGFICPHCEKEINLFGSGGGEKSAVSLKVPFLGRIAVEPEIALSGDSGSPFIKSEPNARTTKKIKNIIDKITSAVENK